MRSRVWWRLAGPARPGPAPSAVVRGRRWAPETAEVENYYNCMATNLERLLKNFPEVDFAMGYGSGVFEQEGYDYQAKNLPMVDLVFATKDPLVSENVVVEVAPDVG